MIHFGLSSVLITVFVSNLLLVVISLLFLNEDLLAKIGFRLTAVFCIMTLIRFLFPFELPFAKTIIFPRFISDGLSALRRRHIIFPGFKISVWDIFCLIWLVESIRRLSILLYNHWKLKMLLQVNSNDMTQQEPYASVLRRLCTEKQRHRIRLRASEFVNVPLVIGLLNPLILLPANTDSSDQEIMFALRHEINHYVHHDLWLKFAVNCLVAAYWWNPFTQVLRKQISILLEMRVDDSIVSEGQESSVGYISSMLHYMDKTSKKEDSSQYMELALKKKSDLSHRLCMIQNKGQRHSLILSTVMLLTITIVYISSYMLIFENSSYRQTIRESDSYTVPSDEDCFAIRNDNGTYTVYFPSWDYNETVDSLEHYPKIKVYMDKEEYNETSQNP